VNLCDLFDLTGASGDKPTTESAFDMQADIEEKKNRDGCPPVLMI
jgi:hypothetical protein